MATQLLRSTRLQPSAAPKGGLSALPRLPFNKLVASRVAESIHASPVAVASTAPSGPLRGEEARKEARTVSRKHILQHVFQSSALACQKPAPYNRSRSRAHG